MSLRTLLSLPWRRAMMLRTALGFGVHSPFAYGFICNVLRNPHPFYAFRRDVTDPAGRRLFRVVNRFNPSTVALIGPDTANARRIIALCCPAARLVTNPADADFIYLAPGADAPADFKVLYAENMPQPPTDAMTFSNGSQCIAIRRPALPPQSFTLFF